MGGFTVIYLKDRSEENIRKHNELLAKHRVPKRYRFYSMADVQFEYDGFCKGTGVFPEHMFPKSKIRSFEDFKKYWNPEAVGEVFVPYTGSMSFDCYFGRTSKNAMRNIGKYLLENHNDILAVSGSFTTFMERASFSKYNLLWVQEWLDTGKIKDVSRVTSLYQSPYEKIYP